jgi:hypothetical protein
VITQFDIDAVAEAARGIPPTQGSYIETDYILNLMETVLDYQTNTKAVVRALEHYKEHHWDELRTREDLRALFVQYPENKEGNIALAEHLWGYKMWTRAQQLRDLVVFFRRAGVVDQPTLKEWAFNSSFKNDFEGEVKGLGHAVYNWLIMRQGVDTVKPDVHVRRFAEQAAGRPLSDQDVVDVVTAAAHQLGMKAYKLDWAIWEASRGGALPYPDSVNREPNN